MTSVRTIFFWCCKPLGLRCLRYWQNLIENKFPYVKIVGICISRRDKTSSEIKAFATQNGIAVYDENQAIPSGTDLGFCIGFDRKIDRETIHSCKNGIINLHFAPLPHYRGSGTLTHAIINKEKYYGLSLHYMDEHLDTGDIIEVRWIQLAKNVTALEIIPQLEELGFTFFKDYAEVMITKKIPATSQVEIIQRDSLTPRFCTRDSVKKMHKLDLSWSFQRIYLYMRALSLGKKDLPYFEKNGKKIYLTLSSTR